MKDSGPANGLPLPMEIDESQIRQLLIPVEDWFVVVMENGHVYSWGRNSPGYVRACEKFELEIAVARNQGRQEQVLKLSDTYAELRSAVNEPMLITILYGRVVTCITCTWDKGLALTDKGEVYILKNSEGWSTAHLQDFSINYPAAAVASGKFHFLVLLQNGRVCSWERGLAMGHGESALQLPSPKIIKAFRRHRIVQIAAGGVHSLFLTSEGQLFACGLNFMGQLCLSGKPSDHKGIPTPVDTRLLFLNNERRKKDEGTPVRWKSEEELLALAGGVKVKAIAAGSDRSSVLFDTGDVFETLSPQVPAYL